MESLVDLSFFKNRKVFLTGHTGFKGSWLSKILLLAGADLTGYSLPSNTDPSLFDLLGLESSMHSIIGDIRDFESLKRAYSMCNPDIVIHLAAQPLVRESYREPRYTYDVNVMGTVNLLECIRDSKIKPQSVLNVTTDKVYLNKEWEWGYREHEPLDGYDPYSNSKSCSELVTHSYINSFFNDLRIPVSTARAGNVIGGGDFSQDRILPDCIRAALSSEDIVVRNPHSIRPYQHVLEPLFAYLMIVEKQSKDFKYAGFYNVGPDESSCISTGNIVDIFCKEWGSDQKWINKHDGGPHEANFLKLDCSKLKSVFHWKPLLEIDQAVALTNDWAKVYQKNGNISEITEEQIMKFYKGQGQI